MHAGDRCCKLLQSLRTCPFRPHMPFLLQASRLCLSVLRDLTENGLQLSGCRFHPTVAVAPLLWHAINPWSWPFSHRLGHVAINKLTAAAKPWVPAQRACGCRLPCSLMLPLSGFGLASCIGATRVLAHGRVVRVVKACFQQLRVASHAVATARGLVHVRAHAPAGCKPRVRRLAAVRGLRQPGDSMATARVVWCPFAVRGPKRWLRALRRAPAGLAPNRVGWRMKV